MKDGMKNIRYVSTFLAGGLFAITLYGFTSSNTQKPTNDPLEVVGVTSIQTGANDSRGMLFLRSVSTNKIKACVAGVGGAINCGKSVDPGT
jgi:hypothetical protein